MKRLQGTQIEQEFDYKVPQPEQIDIHLCCSSQPELQTVKEALDLQVLHSLKY
jgi:hypothetical protein